MDVNNSWIIILDAISNCHNLVAVDGYEVFVFTSW